MLPWSLKVVWFALSLSGLVACWSILLSFGKAVGRYWIPVAYCVACTMLEGIFCIGMAWKMDPFRMPKAFCIAQPVIIGFSACCLSGITTSFALATNDMLTDKDPRRSQGAFVWKRFYALPILVIPALSAAGQAIAIVKLHAVFPADSIHCDVQNPLWVRFLGYAGAPVLVSLPGLIVSVRSTIHIARARRLASLSGEQPLSISQNFSYDHGPFTRLPQRANMRRGSRQPTPSPVQIVAPSPIQDVPLSPMSVGREAIRPGVRSPVLSARQFHLPFSPVDPKLRTPQSSLHAPTPDLDRVSTVSSEYPTFAPNSAAFRNNSSPGSRVTPPPDPTRVQVYEYPPSETDGTQSIQIGEAEDWRHLNHKFSEEKEKGGRGLSPIQWNRQMSEPGDTFSSSRSSVHAQYDYNWDELMEKHVNGYAPRREKQELQDEGFVIIDEQHYKYVVDDDDYRAYAITQDSQVQQPRRPLSALSAAAISSFTRARITLPRPTSANLSPAIWRILLFQITFSFVVILASISTIIDIAVHDPGNPSMASAFGTQHVALLLAAWGPVIVFTALPSVRKNFKLSPSGTS